jgi:hypothetical protein
MSLFCKILIKTVNRTKLCMKKNKSNAKNNKYFNNKIILSSSNKNLKNNKF